MNGAGCAIPEESLDALYNLTLCVYLDLIAFSQEGTHFEYIFYENICKSALSEFPNAAELLSEMVTETVASHQPKIPLFVNEIGCLGVKDRFQFSDLKSPSSKKDSSKAYSVFFRTLGPLFLSSYVFCVIAGRVDTVVLRQDTRCSPIIFLPLDPLPCQSVHYIMEHSLYNQSPIQQIRFPSNRQELDRCSRVVYQSMLPMSYPNGQRGVNSILNGELSVEDLGKKLETIPMMGSLFVNRETIKPRMVAVFSTMLLASALEIPLHTHGTHSYLMNLGIHSSHIVDIVSDFGFYYTFGEGRDSIKLVYPKIVLKYLGSYYNKIPMIRFISHLFSTIIPSDSPVGGGLRLEILFSLVVYLKLCFCSKLGEISIFQKTFMENYLLVDDVQSRKRIPLPQYVTSFNSSVSGDANTADTTYHPNAWNIFYDVFLSKEDGIFIPFSQYSKGPDLIIRLSKNVTEETISPSQMTDSNQLVIFSSQEEPIVYLIGISLECYHLAGQGAGLSHIKNETEKFLIPVAQQLDLEAKNIVAIQLVVSTKYTKEVIRQFTDHQNWILNSGVYYENGNGQLLCQSLSSAPASFSTNEWLTIPSRCQLVVCSTTSLQSFLGPEAYSQLEHVFRNEDAIQSDSKLFPLSSALPSWLQEILKDEPNSRRVGFGMEMRSDANAMQVEYTREAQSAHASKRCGFSEASVIEGYPESLRVLTPSSFPYLKDQWLFSLGIEPKDVPIILVAIVEYMNERENLDSQNL
eukprot:jgi/Galph1/2930/GphlegSOOS_G1609.1